MVPDAEAEVRAYWRVRLEDTMHAYLYRMTYFDPRSPEQIAVKACWTEIAEHGQALLAAVDKLEAIDSWRTGVLKHVIVFATDPATPPADYQVWKNQNAEAARLAAREMKGFKKSASGSNRSRGRAVDHLFEMLLTFWVECGGCVGKGAKSPSTLFVEAAASRALAKSAPAVKLPRAIVDFASKRVDWTPPLPSEALLDRKAIVQLERRKNPSNCTE